MRRNQFTLVGVLLAAVALIVIASGCSSNNPVAPDTSPDIVYENPQHTPYIPNGEDPSSPGIDAHRADQIEDEALRKSTPIPNGEDSPQLTDRVRDLVDDDAIKTMTD